MAKGYTTNLYGLLRKLAAGGERPLPVAPTDSHAACREPSGGRELSMRNLFIVLRQGAAWDQVHSWKCLRDFKNHALPD